MKALRRRLAHLCYRRGPVCFRCGKPGPKPCPEHAWGGTLLASFHRRWVPWWLARHVDPRWDW